MKIILAAMAAVIVILVVALRAALMDKPRVVVREVPARIAPDSRPAFTQPQNQQRQYDLDRLRRDEKRRIEKTKEAMEQAIKEELKSEAYHKCLRTDNMEWDFVSEQCVVDEQAMEREIKKELEREARKKCILDYDMDWDFVWKKCVPR